MTSASDNLYARRVNHVVDFAFDASVASVFPDMLRRSIPGYETVIPLLGVIAGRYARDGSNIYDLGCSLGAATLAMQNQIQNRSVHYHAIDSSEAMTERCATNLSSRIDASGFTVRTEDILDTELVDASVVVLNFTLQFVDPDRRQEMIDSIYHALNPGGVLILSEKIRGANDMEDAVLNRLYYDFKSANGYSDLEISQKRNALEKVMRLDTLAAHEARIQRSGFSSVSTWYQCFNFCSLIAEK